MLFGENERNNIMKTYPRRYKADLVRTTSIRIDQALRDEAEAAASAMGLTFGQFVRQSLKRNIAVCQEVEKELIRQVALKTMGQK